jgi:hypothetical protein
MDAILNGETPGCDWGPSGGDIGRDLAALAIRRICEQRAVGTMLACRQAGRSVATNPSRRTRLPHSSLVDTVSFRVRARLGVKFSSYNPHLDGYRVHVDGSRWTSYKHSKFFLIVYRAHFLT